jgi:hypothetical protein
MKNRDRQDIADRIKTAYDKITKIEDITFYEWLERQKMKCVGEESYECAAIFRLLQLEILKENGVNE